MDMIHELRGIVGKCGKCAFFPLSSKRERGLENTEPCGGETIREGGIREAVSLSVRSLLGKCEPVRFL